MFCKRLQVATQKYNSTPRSSEREPDATSERTMGTPRVAQTRRCGVHGVRSSKCLRRLPRSRGTGHTSVGRVTAINCLAVEQVHRRVRARPVGQTSVCDGVVKSRSFARRWDGHLIFATCDREPHRQRHLRETICRNGFFVHQYRLREFLHGKAVMVVVQMRGQL